MKENYFWIISPELTLKVPSGVNINCKMLSILIGQH